jgi:hypothetical protein
MLSGNMNSLKRKAYIAEYHNNIEYEKTDRNRSSIIKMFERAIRRLEKQL